MDFWIGGVMVLWIVGLMKLDRFFAAPLDCHPEGIFLSTGHRLEITRE